MIRRQKTIDTLRSHLDNSDVSYIALVGEKGIGKSTLLRELESDGFFSIEGGYSYVFLDSETTFDTNTFTEGSLTIIDTEEPKDEAYWEDIINQAPENQRILFTHATEVSLPGVENVRLSIVSFREYADSQGYPIEINKVLSGESDIDRLNDLKETYMQRGGFPIHLTHPETIIDDFSNKRAIIESKVFKKENEVLMEFMRTIAMNIGNLFKADQIAKLLGISRRKVNKYTEILLESGIIKAVGPWGPNTHTETSRHVKLYFTDLSFVKVLLGETFNQGTLKLGAVENFIFLELERKLDVTHSISYYRKKSGAEITFILENQDTGSITPVEVTLRESEAVSQVFRTFDDDYHDKVDRYMLINSRIGGKKDINGTMFIILPHVAI